MLTTGQAPLYCYIFQIFRKNRKANSIKLSVFFPDFRLKYCGEEVYISQATPAINVSTIRIPLKIPNTTAKELQ